MEKEPKNKLEEKFHEKLLQDFIVDSEIDPEDFHLIKTLLGFPQTRLIEFYNVFNVHKDKSGDELKRWIRYSADDPHIATMYEAALEFYSKYGWIKSHNLVRTLVEL